MTNFIDTTEYRTEAHSPIKLFHAFSVAALGMALILSQPRPAEAAPLPQHPCTADLDHLLAEWSDAGFDTPSKPGQAIVDGRDGRVSSGPEVTAMADRILQAIADCRHGDVAAVEQIVSSVSKKLRAG